MTARSPRALVPAVVLVLAALLSGCGISGAYDLPLPGGISAKDSYTVKADFSDVLNVVPRSAVMVDDVPVGDVVDVKRVGWHAEITMRVRKDVVLPDNATAQIRQTSLLGEKYVALLPPQTGAAHGRLSDGDVIPLSATGRNPEVEEVLGALSFLLSGGGVGQLATITHELNAAMDGRQDRLRQLLSRLEGVVGTLDDQKASIIRALTSVNDLTRTLNREKRTIGAALTSIAPAVKVLSDQQRNLMRMLRSLDRLGDLGGRLIGASKDDVITTLRNLEPVLTQLRRAGSSIGPGLSLLLSFPFPKESNNIVHGDYANTVMTVDVALSQKPPSRPGNPATRTPGPSPATPKPPKVLPQLPSLPHLLPSLPGGSGSTNPLLPSLPLLRSASPTALREGPSLASCARGGDVLSAACGPWVASRVAFNALQLTCRDDRFSPTGVCRSIAPLPLLPGADASVSERALSSYDTALTTAFDTPMGQADQLYAGGAV